MKFNAIFHFCHFIKLNNQNLTKSYKQYIDILEKILQVY